MGETLENGEVGKADHETRSGGKSFQVHQLQEERTGPGHQLTGQMEKGKASKDSGVERRMEEARAECSGGTFQRKQSQEDTMTLKKDTGSSSSMSGCCRLLTQKINENKTCLDVSYKGLQGREMLKQSNPNAEEKHVVWEVELKVAQEQHMNAVAELESVKKDLERLKGDLVTSLRDKENALRQAEEALMAAELNAKRVEELSHEMSGTNESLTLVKMACIEASKERAALVAAKGHNASHISNVSENSMLMVEELEMKLAIATKELTRLQEELAMAKEAEVRVASAASEAFANLALAKSELEEMRIQTCGVNEPSSIHPLELKAKKYELEKALENGASLQASLDALQSELETMGVDLVNLKNREEIASAAVATLNVELTKTKEELASAIAAESKANEAVEVLTHALEQIRVEAEEAKQNVDTLKEEASRARADAEYAKSALAAAEREMQAAMEAAMAAKTAEEAALERLKVLSENMNQSSTMESGIRVSRGEYEQLKKKAQESEDLANSKIAAANAQVEAVKKSEMQLQEKVKALSGDIDLMRNNTNQALRRAEMAEVAKRIVECEMKRLREHENGRQRGITEYETGIERGNATTQAIAMGSKSQHFCYSAVQPPESLAQVLKMKTPFLAHDARMASERALAQKKKKHYILPTFNIFSSKKNQPSAGSMIGT
ncbi:hypothetical protein KP509_02G094200 [Ceratopteris richardii]|uniref:WEB family protein n=1 Tax=Ceratopteris richardii TaxID=49495 RepID=A0A8T2V8Q3_CERRI|nr:hypothetical protein KP509_02G094200 [Ceratopteris richardii]KAH7444853.1 hypothetical protein KP509_02G094200 [Ceratopteris richardii]KAH7444854.1 hypothetical protein KP509_02G094200 [Ceratopteris richardii]